jgi:D-alanyl-D-alanine carboxypeptidase (penicillin-binding protein 5/6)
MTVGAALGGSAAPLFINPRHIGERVMRILRGLIWGLTLALVFSLAAAAAPKKANKSTTRRTAAKSAPYRGLAKDPYLGAIAVDAANGRVIFNDNADAPGYPASVIKLMDLLIILEKIQQGALRLSDPVKITAEAARIGGSQVYLKEGEMFSVDDLLYAMLVQSANDAATALAIHVAGSVAAFVEQMNRKAQELGMAATRIYTVHGLPPADGKRFDVTTARDLSILARAVLKYPDTLRYTSTREHPFRYGTFIMRTHNHLLGNVPGCDGLKTGFISAGGYSLVGTAQRNGVRVVSVVLGSRSRITRDEQVAALLNKGLAAIPPPPPVTALAAPPPVVEPAVEHKPFYRRHWFFVVLGGTIFAVGLILILLAARPKRKE